MSISVSKELRKAFGKDAASDYIKEMGAAEKLSPEQLAAYSEEPETNLYPEFREFVSTVEDFAIKTWELSTLLETIETNSQNDDVKETIKDLSSDESKNISELNNKILNLAKIANNKLNILIAKIRQNAGKVWLPNNDEVRRNVSTLKNSINMARNSIESIREMENNKSGKLLTNRNYDTKGFIMPGPYEDVLLAVYEFVVLIQNYIADPYYAVIKPEYDALYHKMEGTPELSDSQKEQIKQKVENFMKVIKSFR